MAMSEEQLLLQMEILASKTSDNANMPFKGNATLNKGLNPEYFSGNATKIVNAINQLASTADMAIETSQNVANKLNELLLDTNTTDNALIWDNVKGLMGKETIIEGLEQMLQGKQADKILGIKASDVNKVLTVDVDGSGKVYVKPVENMPAGDAVVEPPKVDEIEYLNDDVPEISNVKEALDYAVSQLAKGNFGDGGTIIGGITWDMIEGKPEHIVDSLVLTEDHLQLKDGASVISTVPILSDSDVEELINKLK